MIKTHNNICFFLFLFSDRIQLCQSLNTAHVKYKVILMAKYMIIHKYIYTKYIKQTLKSYKYATHYGLQQ